MSTTLLSNWTTTKSYAYHNQGLLHGYKTVPEFQPHIKNTQKLILKGVEGLAEKKKVVVLGPNLADPLEQLDGQFEEIVLVDIDPAILKQMAQRIHKSVVKCIELDLSHGLNQAVDTAFNSVRNDSCTFLENKILRALMNNHKIHVTAPQGTSPIVTKFKTLADFQIQPIELPKELCNANYVVSSLVASQLSCCVLRMNFEYHRVFGVNITQGARPQEVDAWQTEQNRITDQLNAQHLIDLKSMVNSNGRVYFGDTVNGHLKSQPPEPTCNLADIHSKLAHLYDPLAGGGATWDWVVSPTSGYTQGVEAHLLRPQ